jgi:hypothetical protein
MERAMSVQEMRTTVSAKDKAFAMSKPFAESVKYLHERYGTDQDSAAKFVRWLRGMPAAAEPGEGGEAAAGGAASGKGASMEKWHLKFDEVQGAWVKVDDRAPAAE